MKYDGLSVEASYRYDERLSILGCYGKPTKDQHDIAFSEAIEFDIETARRKRNQCSPNHPLQSDEFQPTSPR